MVGWRSFARYRRSREPRTYLRCAEGLSVRLGEVRQGGSADMVAAWAAE